MKEAMFWEKENDIIACKLCARQCKIKKNNTGFCKTRENIDGKLFSLVYGKINSMNVDPIEKKPFFHFAPGTKAFSISTVGCTFLCKFCCNPFISQTWKEIGDREIIPEEVVEIAKKKAKGIAYTYSEPTVFFEYAYDIAKLAQKEGLYNVFVTNGYTMPEPIKKISPFLDAAVIDFKASGNPDSYKRLCAVPDVEPIYEAIKTYKENNVFLEITNLMIPGEDTFEDVKKLAKWVLDNVGEETPFHIIRFFPSHQLDLPQTDLKTLEKAFNIAKKVGLKYVYLGNTGKKENTICPKCKKVIIERTMLGATQVNLKDSSCSSCGEDINIGGTKWLKR